MTHPPVEFWVKLKSEFAKETGYDADEDSGYFLEWVVSKLWEKESG